MGYRVECLLEVHKAHIERLLVFACFMHQCFFEIRDMVFCSHSLSESRLFICNFCFCLYSDPFQYDPKKYLACMWDISNYSVTCTLFKIVHSSGHSPVSRIATDIPCILFSTIFPALKSSAGTLSGTAALLSDDMVRAKQPLNEVVAAFALNILVQFLSLQSKSINYKLAPYGTGGRLLLTANFKVTWHKK